MSTMQVPAHKTLIKGAEFLLRNTEYETVFIPEDFSEEQMMIGETVVQFINNELLPIWDKLEKQEKGLSEMLLEKMAELGFLGSHMPERYGGLEMDAITNTVIAEKIGPSGGFTVTFNAHTGIGMLPILYFGTEEQKQKYLPKLITGEWKASYCLTEPGSGSDALAAKSKAILSEDGKYYILNGQKMWITNAGFADVFTVFAQIDGDKFTGFILEKGMEGFTLGEEEKKLGIKSSSTRQIFMENVKVPVENVLGEIGKGHLIAFNVLNAGRYKLGVSCLGGAKKLSTISVKYANERHQFKRPIASFGAIQHKLAEQLIRNFVLESVIYRIAGLMDELSLKLTDQGDSYGKAKLEAAKEYALECSIVKLLGSETLDYCVDEAVQIHGGMGYSEEGVVAQAYRDSRINRIFEGTNEINRMLMVNIIFKKAMKGEMDIATPAMAVQQELMGGEEKNGLHADKYSHEIKAVRNFKKVLFMLLGSAAKKAMGGKMNLKEEQEILMNCADIITDIYSAESLLLRVRKLDSISHEQTAYFDLILKTFLHDANQRIATNAINAVGSFINPAVHEQFISGIRKFTNYPLQNTKENRRELAQKLITANKYFL